MKHVIMGTAGHVDHGKTSLVKALTGIDCDTHKEEKRRGITINLGFSYLDLPGGESVGIIDVPGHKDFINTMVGGACGIDFVMLVIAADSGIMPQTREHLNIIHSLGVEKGLIALTKADLVDEEGIELAQMEIHEFLEGSGLEDAPVIPVSSVTGKGLDDLKKVISDIISELDVKEKSGVFRLYIDRIFSVKGFGSVVTGSVLSGSIKPEQEIFLLPGDNEIIRVRSIERHGKTVSEVVAGDRAAINISGLKPDDFQRGMLLSDKKLKETTLLDAEITLFDSEVKLALWSHVLFHSGTFESPARIHALSKDQIRPGESVVVQIHLERPAVLLNKDRFILRNSSGDRSLGGGFIMDASPLHHRKRSSALIQNLTVLAETLKKGDSLNEMIRLELKKESRAFTLAELAVLLHMSEEELKQGLDRSSTGFVTLDAENGLLLIDVAFFEQRSAILKSALLQYHKDFPIFQDGLDVNEIAGKLALSKSKTDRFFLMAFLKRLVQEGLLVRSKSTWIINGHQAALDERTIKQIKWLEDVILDYGVQKTVLSEIEEKAEMERISKHDLKMYLSYLTKNGRVLYFQNEFVHVELVNKYRPVLLELLSQQEQGIEINVFKEKMNASKRFCSILVGLYETEKIISSSGTGIDTRIFITQNGKNVFNDLSR